MRPSAAPLVERSQHRRAFRRRDARRSLDHGRGRFHQDRRRGHVRAARSGAARAGVEALRPDLDRRGLRQRGRRARAARPTSCKPRNPVLGEQGRRRSAGVQLLGDLRRAGHRHARVEQLRTVPVSRKGHPAVRHQRDRRHPGAALRRRPQRPRLAARARSLPRDRPADRHRRRTARSTTSAAATKS